MSDFTTDLFLAEGAVEPAVLPGKLVLPDGKSRYTYSIELGEIHACGYDGPIYIPSYNHKEERLVWNLDQKAYLVEPLTEQEIKDLDDYKVRAQLHEILATEKTVLANKELVAVARESYFRYFGKCQYLLDSEESLSWEDVPVAVLPKDITQEQVDETYNKIVDQQWFYWKQAYEIDSSTPWVLHVETRDRFVPPEDWIQGSIPNGEYMDMPARSVVEAQEASNG